MQAENEGQRKLRCREDTASRRHCYVHGEQEIKNKTDMRCKTIVRQ